jgi:amino acid transporter
MTIFWTFGGVFAILICVLVIAKNGRNSGSFAFGKFEANTGWPEGWSFCIGLLHAAYATSATGMILSMCEEVQEPATQVPKAMCGALILNWLCGIIFLIPLMFVLPDLLDVISDPYGQPLPFILRSAIGNEGGAFALTVPVLVLAIFCGVACTTAASRCVWAFSRDGAIPGSNWWKKVNKGLDVPLNAMMLSMVVQLLLGLIYFGSYAAFNAFSGSGVIFLTISYVMPIFVSLIGGRTHLNEGSWNFGTIGVVCNVIAIAWSFFVVPLFSFPFFNPTTPDTMNYASAVFVGGVLICGIWYLAWGKKHYQGPPAQAEEVERRRSSIVPH